MLVQGPKAPSSKKRDWYCASHRRRYKYPGNMTVPAESIHRASVADLELALALADVADRVSIERFRALDLRVQTKADMTLVSDADKACEAAVRQVLHQERPDDAILGEEEGLEEGSSGRQWVIDPIDGTHNYVRAVPVWATLIGLIEDGVPVLGVVSAPALGRRWWASEGKGAFTSASYDGSIPRAINVSDVATLDDAFFSYSSYQGWHQANLGEQFDRLVDECWRTRGFGDFWSYMLVAEGVVDLAAEPELALHDMAALVPIITEAGGRFTNLDGEPGPWGPGAVATNGKLHDMTLDILSR